MHDFPFNLTGPEFLVFFAIFGLVVALFPLYRRRRQGDAVPQPLPRITDPIQIATLRGGYEEAVRMVVVILVDRALIEREGRILSAVEGREGFLKSKLELAVYNFFKTGQHPSGVFKDSGVVSAGEAIEGSLESSGLRVTRAQRQHEYILSAATFCGVALVRILLSGPPFAFLIVEAAMLLVLGYWVSRQGMNGRALRLLNQLQELFARLKLRAKLLGKGSQGKEVELLAAVFGLGALPFSSTGTLRLLKKPGDSGSSCGSSGCGGGGGCGGGCGGECGGG